MTRLGDRPGILARPDPANLGRKRVESRRYERGHMDKTEVARYAQAAIPRSELQEAADAAVVEVLADPVSRRELSRYELEEENFRSIRFLVEQKPGVDPGSVITVILIAAAGQLTGDGIKALWEATLQRIRKHKGRDSLDKQVDPPEPNGLAFRQPARDRAGGTRFAG